jgi:hypothetical protein
MKALDNRQQLSVGFALAALMILTRGQHLSAVGFMPDASWAVFFLAGAYLRPVWTLPLYMLLALGLDLLAVGWGGVSGFCLSPAYFFLVPAHAVLWGAGRWFARVGRFDRVGLLHLVGAVLVSSLLAELLSSGGFYLFSGRFTDLYAAELGSRLVTYYPASLEALALYVGIAVFIHAVVSNVLDGNRREAKGG